MADEGQNNETQQKKGHGKGNPVVEQTVDIVLAEYNTLRAELLQRIATRYQIMGLAFSAFAAILAVQAFGAGNQAGLYLVLLYPILAFFLLNVYIANSRHMRTIEEYIKKKLEAPIKSELNPPFQENFGWQTYYDNDSRVLKRGQSASIGGRFVFPATAIVTLVSAFPGVWLEAGYKSPFLYAVFWVSIVFLLISFAQSAWDYLSDVPPGKRKHLLRNIASELKERREAKETREPVPDLE
jgi:hypothetical protein